MEIRKNSILSTLKDKYLEFREKYPKLNKFAGLRKNPNLRQENAHSNINSLINDVYKIENVSDKDSSPEAKALIDYLVNQVQTTDKRHPFLDLIRKVESDNIRNISSGAGAKGVYQFKDMSVKPFADVDAVKVAKERAIQLGFDENYIRAIKNNPKIWEDDQADILTIANLFNQSIGKKGFVDDLLVKAFSGDRQSMQDAYYKLHYQGTPTTKTKERVNKYMPITGPFEEYDYKEKY